MRTLQREMNGTDVRVWQEFLIGQGLLEAGNATGHFGPKTEEATRHYQAVHGLQADGVLGPKTLATAQGDGFVEND